MALASVPVVSEVGDLPIYVLGGRQPAGAIVPPSNTQALANTLVYLLAHPKVRTEMAHAARQRAENTYAWTTLSEKLDDFLRLTAEKAAKLPQVAGEHDV
jgi:glycosyltransferase involved in cell wall biosynthesis